MNGTPNERMLARERLPWAIFVVPLLIAMAAAIPSLFVLLMIHAFMDLLSELLHQQIRLFDNCFYIFVFSPAIFLSVSALLVTLVVYWKSALAHGRRFAQRSVVRTTATLVQSAQPTVQGLQPVTGLGFSHQPKNSSIR